MPSSRGALWASVAATTLAASVVVLADRPPVVAGRDLGGVALERAAPRAPVVDVVTLPSAGAAAATDVVVASSPASTAQAHAVGRESARPPQHERVAVGDPAGPPARVASPGGAAGSPPGVSPPPARPDRSAAARPPPDAPTPPPSPASSAVHPDDFPDPFVLRAGATYWAFATQSGFAQVPTMRSVDLVHWERTGDALARLPEWAAWGHVWAPSVLERSAAFVLYYTTRHRGTGLQCISRALALLAGGPYVDSTTGPLVCQTERGGSIDPSPFVDHEGRPWLLWKSEGTLLGEPTRIWVQQLTADGQGLVGEATQLLEVEAGWEHPIVEGPAMAVVGGRYHLLYSGNRWETADYGVGHAVCDSPTGPCRRTSTTPVLATRAGEAGPGSPELVTTPAGDLALVHHAWEPGVVGYPHGSRRIHVSALTFEGDHIGVGRPWRRADIGP